MCQVKICFWRHPILWIKRELHLRRVRRQAWKSIQELPARNPPPPETTIRKTTPTSAYVTTRGQVPPKAPPHPPQRSVAASSRRDDGDDLLNPLNPLSPINPLYHIEGARNETPAPAPVEETITRGSGDFGGAGASSSWGDSSSSYDSGSSSYDSGSSSSCSSD